MMVMMMMMITNPSPPPKKKTNKQIQQKKKKIWEENHNDDRSFQRLCWAPKCTLVIQCANMLDSSLRRRFNVLCSTDPLVGLVVKASTSRAEGPGFESRFRWDFFGVESHQWLKNWQWLPCKAPGAIRSVLGLVGPVSVYCDWMRWKVWSATSISLWQHIKLSEQIRPRDTLACCWDVKATNSVQRFDFGAKGCYSDHDLN